MFYLNVSSGELAGKRFYLDSKVYRFIIFSDDFSFNDNDNDNDNELTLFIPVDNGMEAILAVDLSMIDGNEFTWSFIDETGNVGKKITQNFSMPIVVNGSAIFTINPVVHDAHCLDYKKNTGDEINKPKKKSSFLFYLGVVCLIGLLVFLGNYFLKKTFFNANEKPTDNILVKTFEPNKVIISSDNILYYYITYIDNVIRISFIYTGSLDEAKKDIVKLFPKDYQFTINGNKFDDIKLALQEKLNKYISNYRVSSENRGIYIHIDNEVSDENIMEIKQFISKENRRLGYSFLKLKYLQEV